MAGPRRRRWVVDMRYYVYILRSKKTHRFYIGQSNNVGRRLQEHNTSKTKSTRAGAPWLVVHQEQFGSRSEAFAREQQIKRYKGGEAFKKLLGL